MHQILGLRKSYKARSRATEVFFERGWRAISLQALFHDLDFHLNPIPEDERWNLYFTVAEVKEQPGRILMRQDVIPFDIDDITPGTEAQVAEVALATLKLDPAKTPVIFSGHGVQFFALTPLVITQDVEFEELRPHYKALCAKLGQALIEAGLKGHGDPSVWSAARLMRLPGTINRKEGLPDVQASLYQKNLELQNWDIKEQSGVIDLAPKDYIRKELFAKVYPSPDQKAVLEGCDFLRYVNGSANVSEPEWYAALGILSYLPDSDRLAIEYSQSSKRADYTDQGCLKKLRQAHDATSGPRTCSNIHSTIGFEGCAKCPNFGKVTTPLAIHGPDFIRTEKNGFHEVIITANGQIKNGPPAIADLVKFWMKKNKHVSHSGNVWRKEPTHWVQVDDHELLAFAQRHFDPKPDSFAAREFVQMIERENLVGPDFWDYQEAEVINLKNGVLDMATRTLRPHTDEDKFKYVLPYEWNPGCSSALFDSFLDDICCGDQGLVQLILEYMAYSLANIEPLAEKALFLYGDGANGKSTLLHVIKALLGAANVSEVSIYDMGNKNSLRFLDGALVNLCEEMDKLDMRTTNILKRMITGGEVTAKALYKNEYQFRNRAKFIIAGNRKPYTEDTEGGFLRRFVFAPMLAEFKEGVNRDPELRFKLATPDSLSGILARVIDYWQPFKERRYRFIEPKVSLEEHEIFAAENDSVLDFCNTHFIIDPEGTHEKREVFAEYMAWCRDEKNVRPQSAVNFWRGVRKYCKQIEFMQRKDGARLVVGIKMRIGTRL